MIRNVQLKVNLPRELVTKLEPLLDKKGLTLDDVVRLYLRSLVTVSERRQAVRLDQEMPFGKYKGERLDVIIRSEPEYISWLLDKMINFRIEPEALDLLEEELIGEENEV